MTMDSQLQLMIERKFLFIALFIDFIILILSFLPDTLITIFVHFIQFYWTNCCQEGRIKNLLRYNMVHDYSFVKLNVDCVLKTEDTKRTASYIQVHDYSFSTVDNDKEGSNSEASCKTFFYSSSILSEFRLLNSAGVH